MEINGGIWRQRRRRKTRRGGGWRSVEEKRKTCQGRRERGKRMEKKTKERRPARRLCCHCIRHASHLTAFPPRTSKELYAAIMVYFPTVNKTWRGLQQTERATRHLSWLRASRTLVEVTILWVSKGVGIGMRDEGGGGDPHSSSMQEIAREVRFCFEGLSTKYWVRRDKRPKMWKWRYSPTQTVHNIQPTVKTDFVEPLLSIRPLNCASQFRLHSKSAARKKYISFTQIFFTLKKGTVVLFYIDKLLTYVLNHFLQKISRVPKSLRT